MGVSDEKLKNRIEEFFGQSEIKITERDNAIKLFSPSITYFEVIKTNIKLGFQMRSIFRSGLGKSLKIYPMH